MKNEVASIDGLWDEIDKQVDELYEQSRLAVIEARSAELAAFALSLRIFVENPNGLDTTGEPTQSSVEYD